MTHYVRDFRRTPAWQPDPEPSREIAAIKMVCRTTGLSVQIVASVLRGVVDEADRFSLANLVAEPFGTYVVHLDQPLSLHELLRFGIEPLRISVVMSKSSVQTQPRIVNQVPSLEVTRIEERRNAFDLFLTNSSIKPILSLDIKTPRKNGGSGLLQIGWREPLIASGKEHYVSVYKGPADRETGDGLVPDEPRLPEVVIVAALFADGSHEGDEPTAARMMAQWQGIQIQSWRLLAVVKRTLARSVQPASGAIEDFRKEVMSVSESFDLSILENLAERYPSLDEQSKTLLNAPLESGLKGAKQNLLGESEQFERESDPLKRIASFRSWLLRTKEEYEQLQVWSTTP